MKGQTLGCHWPFIGGGKPIGLTPSWWGAPSTVKRWVIEFPGSDTTLPTRLLSGLLHCSGHCLTAAAWFLTAPQSRYLPVSVLSLLSSL